MKNLLLISILLGNTLIVQIPTRSNYDYTLSKLKAKDICFITDLYELLTESSEGHRDIFNRLEYFITKISKKSESAIRVQIEAWSEPTLNQPDGYLIKNDKTFLFFGEGVYELFENDNHKRHFSGNNELCFDDDFLSWELEYSNGSWNLIEYPDKFGDNKSM